MEPFCQVDDASAAGVCEAQPGASAAQPGRSRTVTPFLAPLEQVLGTETEPDAAFFMESWTVGVAAASENFLRRQKQRKSREPEISAWKMASSFTLFFGAGMEAPAEAAQPLRKAYAERTSITHLQGNGDEQEKDGLITDEAEIACPLTLESACRVLGVKATSTREQIKSAYRKMASQYHPDRLASSGPCGQKRASHRMASINEAYRLLCAALPGRWSPC